VHVALQHVHETRGILVLPLLGIVAPKNALAVPLQIKQREDVGFLVLPVLQTGLAVVVETSQLADAVLYVINPVARPDDVELLRLFDERTRLPGASVFTTSR